MSDETEQGAPVSVRCFWLSPPDGVDAFVWFSGFWRVQGFPLGFWVLDMGTNRQEPERESETL